jgi:hypothetical protein
LASEGEEAVMSSAVCSGAAFLISWAALVQARKAQKAGQLGKARIWLLVAVPAGVVALVNLIAILSGMS